MSSSSRPLRQAVVSRRGFVVSSTVAGSFGLALGGLFGRQAFAQVLGDLIPDPDGILDLPAGFSYRIVERAGDAMSDGFVVPRRADGMACFDGFDGTWILLRNHELSPIVDRPGSGHPGQPAPEEAYDSLSNGGVTRVVLDAETLERQSSNLVLTGTNRNCAGGPSPWGWLSCEEDVSPGLRPHGYVFLCPTDAEHVQAIEPIVGYGRYEHEAVCIDPATHIAYLTEDDGESAFYRFVPDAFETPFEGRLQALRVMGQPRFETSNMNVGDVVDVDWVDISEPDPNPLTNPVRDQAHAAGAAVIVRGEGTWLWNGGDVPEIYIVSTSGGPQGRGQVFRLIDQPEGSTLELIAAAASTDGFESPDNITVSPVGQVFVVEDGGGTDFIRLLTPEGEAQPFARNAFSDSEFAGICFSPEGSTMFVNIQADGLTLAITGPFPTVSGGEGMGSSSGGDEWGGTGEGGSESTGHGMGEGESGSSGDDFGSPSSTGGEAPPETSSTGGEAPPETSSGGEMDDGSPDMGCSVAPATKPGLGSVVVETAVIGSRVTQRLGARTQGEPSGDDREATDD